MLAPPLGPWVVSAALSWLTLAGSARAPLCLRAEAVTIASAYTCLVSGPKCVIQRCPECDCKVAVTWRASSSAGERRGRIWPLARPPGPLPSRFPDATIGTCAAAGNDAFVGRLNAKIVAVGGIDAAKNVFGE